MDKRIVGAYDTEHEAIEAIQDLTARGYDSENISVVAKNKDDLDMVERETGTKADEGAVTGAATGGAIGGVTGLLAGIGALAIPGVGPIIAAGPIAAALTGAAVGAGAGGVAGALIGMGIPEDEANRYNSYVDEGKILVLVDEQPGLNTLVDDADPNLYSDADRVNSSLTDTTKLDYTNSDLDYSDTNRDGVRNSFADTTLNETEERTLKLKEEQLNISKDRVEAGEVELHKEVVEDHQTVNVPVSKEEVYIERRDVTSRLTDDTTPIGSDETIRIPVSEEKVNVSKDTVVTGEVVVGKREVEESVEVRDTLKREEVKVDDYTEGGVLKNEFETDNLTTNKLDNNRKDCDLSDDKFNNKF